MISFAEKNDGTIKQNFQQCPKARRFFREDDGNVQLLIHPVMVVAGIYLFIFSLQEKKAMGK